VEIADIDNRGKISLVLVDEETAEKADPAADGAPATADAAAAES
jgi:polyribonucleotide nucleotidyltransferase